MRAVSVVATPDPQRGAAAFDGGDGVDAPPQRIVLAGQRSDGSLEPGDRAVELVHERLEMGPDGMAAGRLEALPRAFSR